MKLLICLKILIHNLKWLWITFKDYTNWVQTWESRKKQADWWPVETDPSPGDTRADNQVWSQNRSGVHLLLPCISLTYSSKSKIKTLKLFIVQYK